MWTIWLQVELTSGYQMVVIWLQKWSKTIQFLNGCDFKAIILLFTIRKPDKLSGFQIMA
jgi:hypothetical protein